ncbi:4-(cytidine 5'-diphospho)-2-C-methyl-D-erythritol kinase [Niabella drilacis]|uniref:4-diphosphocytidyl-2-C-methyl-D-erythritol kinase n=1 Tax=Niabella drilacis (strain DSM 25811 / CCM 8410 / CCUG 62505 / LMG 26954 / E90) TaxID=1285928 RepID=A0A1G6ZGN3_NIADE|nr:4-(cytidine 5'-diphospho)-2-C-methyl-D-erythritol kinase [Niabella drilacis]SDE01808.1 4-diphosphocytidyl-2-C-methyl-D-erythritol kinase [Niabella drilacis]
MVFFSNCKINLGLHIIARRPDGFHDLETVFYPLPIYDVLELLPADETALTLHGLPIPGNKEDNSVWRAWHLLKQELPQLPPVRFHLLKNIPAGAGLGAGSANGATALIALDRFFNLQLSQKQLLKYALHLGSDAPFFILNTPCYATGRGEALQPISLDLSGYHLVLVNPGIHISTPWAFSRIIPSTPAHSLKTLTAPPPSWEHFVTNDFEPLVYEAYPEIKDIRNRLKAAGAVFAAMTGTGSTVFGLFKHPPDMPVFPATCFIRSVSLDTPLLH